VTRLDRTVAPFKFRDIHVRRIVPEITEGPMGAAGPWKWTATVNGNVVRGSSVEDVSRRIGSALDSDRRSMSDDSTKRRWHDWDGGTRAGVV
jgi:hypothetical protein